jgi:hypothetical protein
LNINEGLGKANPKLGGFGIEWQHGLNSSKNVTKLKSESKCSEKHSNLSSQNLATFFSRKNENILTEYSLFTLFFFFCILAKFHTHIKSPNLVFSYATFTQRNF